jgi:peptidoglycan/LPS O-acetylase OafA/YrhL
MAVQKNNFDILRLCAALAVLWSHSFPLTGNLPREPMLRYFGHLTGGSIALDTFFFISGYLVTLSAANRPIPSFAWARALRILPALFVAVVFAMLLGSFFTTLARGLYWTHGGTWDYLRNAYVFGLRFSLPGVFETLPNSGVNGSLWTLPIEVVMYVSAGALALMGIKRPLFFAIIALGSFAGLVAAIYGFGLSWYALGPALLTSVSVFPLLALGLFFMAGAAFAKYQPTLPSWFGLVAIAAIAASPFLPLGQAIYFAAFPFVIYSIAFAPARIELPLDISYGVYLYAFPVQQSIIQVLGPEIGPTAVSLIATPIVCILAVLSAVIVERPALRLKNVDFKAWWSDTALVRMRR